MPDAYSLHKTIPEKDNQRKLRIVSSGLTWQWSYCTQSAKFESNKQNPLFAIFSDSQRYRLLFPIVDYAPAAGADLSLGKKGLSLRPPILGSQKF